MNMHVMNIHGLKWCMMQATNVCMHALRGKVYGESLRLGSEFTRLIAHYDFRLDASLAPCFRIACVATQMSSPKEVDGVAKMIYKADLDAAQLAGNLSEAKKMEVYGRFCVRMVLLVLRKQ